MYSYPGMLITGVLLYFLLQGVAWLIFSRYLSLEFLIFFAVDIYAVLTVLVAISNAALLRHEGIRMSRVQGSVSGGMLIASNLIGLFMYLEGQGIIHTFGIFLSLFSCFTDFEFAGIIISGIAAAKYKPAYDKDFIIIEGCSISKQGKLLPLLKGRTNRAIKFAWEQEIATGKPARYVPSGGQGADEIMSEGSAMELYLLSHGAEQYEVLAEKESKNTQENMEFSKKIIDKEKQDAKVCFVTTNYHVLRSGIIARKAGLDAEGLASGTKWYFWPNGFAREMAGILSIYRKEQAAILVLCLIAAFFIK